MVSGCRLALALAVVACVMPAASSSSSSSSASKVLDLSPDNITSTSQQYKYMMLEFYAPWCGHCQALEPEYSQAAEEISAESSQVVLARLDVTQYPSVQEEYGVKSFPTLKWFEDGKLTSLQPNERQAGKIVEWCRRHTTMSSDVDTVEGLKARIDSMTRFLAVGFFDNTEDKLYHAFQDVESRLKGKDFEMVNNPQVAQAMGVKMPAVRFYTKVEEDNSISETGREILYSGSPDPNELAREVIKLSNPVILKLGDENEEDFYLDDTVPKVLIFRASPQDLEEFRAAAMARDAANFLLGGDGMEQEMRDRFNFVEIVNETNKRISNWAGLQTGEESWVYVIRIDKSKRYRLEEGKLNKVYDNWNATVVKKIVGKQFREFVEQDRHVVIEFFAPWCRHCRALEPKYKLAAKYFETRFPGEFVFGQIDGSKNEVPGSQLSQRHLTTVGPYYSLLSPFDSEQMLGIAESHAIRALEKVRYKIPFLPSSFGLELEPPLHRLRIGYMMADFRHHVTAHLLQTVFQRHDEERFEIFCYALNKVRQLEGSLKPAVKELEEAAARLEALARR
ncbi:hypothetical protein GUITHDRAFT_144104 [Guillardia theta CCMP2712]|uniref:Thioredoxin domain-containing protein n=1 Tax=Guillardia theta (strain CCMP2712) TaxID=905079 RepID=L1IRK0_GUITC|nr:hypothetical protein GUITHDRAFT_144104 [Guillardia theta CCMP2712]EKX38717.1 hypothetical protein GUITHDRAFT_144104 [Guillardia theta CCMP2712]|eukprot:XP_005825697.1 hypothetical protein GUITHDRAFT_144104 [Guillardia theta CCMP2712]